MKLADPDSMLLQSSHGIPGFLKFDRQMASVIIHPENFAQARIVAMLRSHPIEEMNDFAAAFEHAQRLRFEAKVQLSAGLLRDARDVLNAFPEIIADNVQLFPGGNQFLVAAGDGADAAANVSRKKLRQHVEQ